MTGQYSGLPKALETRCIDICAVQETWWSGNKLYATGCSYKLMYKGTRGTTNDNGIVVSSKFDGNISEVQRYDDRLMKIVYITDSREIHIFSAYTPKTGQATSIKDAFWRMLDAKTPEVPPEDYINTAGDLNGHIGCRKEEHTPHGGYGFREKNENGQRILDFSEAHNLAIANTWFKKRDSHLITYYSGTNTTQVNYIPVRCCDLKDVLDVKVIPYKTVVMQHHSLICKLRIKLPTNKHEDHTGPARIKWWKFKDKEADIIAQITLPPITTVEESWEKVKESAHETAHAILGTTKPGRRRTYRDAWLWNDTIKDVVHIKKRLGHEFQIKHRSNGIHTEQPKEMQNRL
ncbi:craniofacial development protein 2-like [Schistocerca piceifrons]|uniref:craniofacial development protein 2-like n=1 Tax=Schistocerca piceifrons TaxID=274613 RepID=UPI001F5E9815|nr:craniofacial development protein 2-like [Schistocerca piceifrons]